MSWFKKAPLQRVITIVVRRGPNDFFTAVCRDAEWAQFEGDRLTAYKMVAGDEPMVVAEFSKDYAVGHFVEYLSERELP